MTAPALPIVLREVAFRPHGRPVIQGLSATIASAGITAIIGPNGAGKSVTLRLLDGLIAPDAGEIHFGARTPDQVRRAFVFQKPALVRADVAHNVALALLPERLSRAVLHERVDAALHRVGLHDRAADPARKLSGGEQQRLALARAWAIRPEVLLLDEPTASLDPGATEAIESLLVDMAASGVKVILVSHHLGQVARLAEDVILLAEGRAMEHGPTDRVLAAPRSAAGRAYLNREFSWTPFAARSRA